MREKEKALLSGNGSKRTSIENSNLTRNEPTLILQLAFPWYASDTAEEVANDEEVEIRQLPSAFQGKGEVAPYYFTLLYQTNRAFCYQVSLKGVITHYEVFRHKINKRFNCVSYPSAKSFGIWAWTYHSKDRALAKLNSL